MSERPESTTRDLPAWLRELVQNVEDQILDFDSSFLTNYTFAELILAYELAPTRKPNELIPDLKGEHVKADLLDRKGFDVGFMIAGGYELSDMYSGPDSDQVLLVPLQKLRAAGYTLEDLKLAGFRPEILTTTGGWPKTEVDRVFGKDETGRAALDDQFQKSLKANQVDAEGMKGHKQDLIDKAMVMYEHRREKKGRKRELKQDSRYWKLKRYIKFRSLKNIETELGKRVKKAQSLIYTLRGKKSVPISKRLHGESGEESRNRCLREAIQEEKDIVTCLQEVGDLIRIKKADKQAYEDAKKKFKDMVKKRTELLKKQRDYLKKAIKKNLGHLESEHKEARKKLKQRTKELGGNFNKETGRPNDPTNILAWRKAYTGLGDPARIKVDQITDPYLPSKSYKPRNPDEKFAHTSEFISRFANDEAERRYPGPLSLLTGIDRRIELLEWPVHELAAEIEALEDYTKLADNTQALWKFVGRIERWFPALYWLAKSPRRIWRTSQLFKKIGHKAAPTLVGRGELIKMKAHTGSSEFHIEFALSLGFAAGGASGGAVMKAGVNIVFSGKVSLDDDRRLRSTVAIKLVPNFEAKVGAGIGPMFKAAGSLGFTILENTYAFVDEKHFAYYWSFRFANLFNFVNQFSKYCKTYARSPIDTFGDDVKRILEKILGPERMDEFKHYLGTAPVIKVITRQKGSISADLGFTDAITGISVSGSASRKSVIFEKKILDTHDAAEPSKTEVEAAQDQGSYWHFKAHGDGDCFYNSLALQCQQYLGRRITIGELRARAAARVLFRVWEVEEKQSAGTALSKTDMLFVVDTSVYTDALDWFNKTLQTKDYADLGVLQGLANSLGLTFKIHAAKTLANVPGNVRSIAPESGVSKREFHFLYTPGKNGSGGHYDPLLSRNTRDQPAVPDAFYDDKVIDELSGVAIPQSDGTVRLTKEGHFSYSAERRADKGLARRFSPRLITLRRDGVSADWSLKEEGKAFIKQGVEVGMSWIWNNANPDNDGKYLNLKLKLGLFARSSEWIFNEETPAIEFEGSRADDQEDFEEFYEDPEKKLAGLFGKECKNIVDLYKKKLEDKAKENALNAVAYCGDLNSVALDINAASRWLEFSFIRDEKEYISKKTRQTKKDKWWRLLYIRWVYTTSTDVGFDFNTGIPLNVGLEIGSAKTVTLQERLGTNTAAYVVTVFNGLKQRLKGYDEWKEFLTCHKFTVKDLFKRVAKKPTSNIAYQIDELQQLVDQNGGVWQPKQGQSEPADWVKGGHDLKQACASAAGQLGASNGQRDRTNGVRTDARISDSDYETLCDALTTLLWRSQKVVARDNAAGNPWRRRIKYVVREAGTVKFDLQGEVVLPPTGGGEEWDVYYVTGLPKFKAGSSKDDTAFQHVSDLYKVPELADAETVLPFYQAGFKLVLKIDMQRKKKRLKVIPIDAVLKLELRHPDGPDQIRVEIEKIVIKAIKAPGPASREKYKYDLQHLVGIDRELGKRFQPYWDKLRQDPSKQKTEEWIVEACNIWEEYVRNPFNRATPKPEDDGFEEYLKSFTTRDGTPFILFAE